VPRVSIIVPARNAEDTLEQTLASALSQTERDLEVVVLDDGSDDATAAIVERLARSDHRVRLLQQAASGVAAARNAAIAASTGEFIAPLDADDIWAPTKIERQLARFASASPRTGLVYAWSIVIDEESRPIMRAPAWRLEGCVLPMLATFHFLGSASSPLIPRRVIEEVGGYDVELRARGAQGCEDWDLALRIAARHEFALAPGYLVGYRRRATSMSSDVGAMWRSYASVMARLAQAHPDLPAPLFRWSRSGFQRYLAGLSGDTRRALRWTGRAIQTDPSLLLSRSALAEMLGATARALLEPLLAPNGSRRRSWLQLAVAPPRCAAPQLLWGLGAEDERALPWNEDRSLHGRLCRARWRVAERYAERMASGSAELRTGDPVTVER
jgi:glycosyltransferase involved in cell wall biosynthesis